MGTFFWIIGVIIGGLIIGLIGKAIVRGRQDIPLWLTIVAGIVGVLIGSGIARLLGADTSGVWNFWEIVWQIIVGAVAVAAAAMFYPRLTASRR